MSSEPSAGAKALSIGVVLLVVLALIGGAMAYRQVPEGHEGVEKNWGAVTGTTLGSGAHFKMPVMTTVQAVETRPRTYTMSNEQSEGARQDADAIVVKTVNGSSVDIDVTVRYTIEASATDTFVEDWNNEEQMEQRLIRPTLINTLQDEASSLQTTGDGSIYTREGRQRLAETARESLQQQFADEPIELEVVQVRDVELPQSIDETLDEKEQAKQQVEVEREKVKQEEARAEQQIVQAQADARAIEIRGEALRQNPIVLQDRMIKAYDRGTVFVTDGDQEIIVDANSTNSTSGNSTAGGVPPSPGGS